MSAFIYWLTALETRLKMAVNTLSQRAKLTSLFKDWLPNLCIEEPAFLQRLRFHHQPTAASMRLKSRERLLIPPSLSRTPRRNEDSAGRTPKRFVHYVFVTTNGCRCIWGRSISVRATHSTANSDTKRYNRNSTWFYILLLWRQQSRQVW